jgi:hypothetical protein
VERLQSRPALLGVGRSRAAAGTPFISTFVYKFQIQAFSLLISDSMNHLRHSAYEFHTQAFQLTNFRFRHSAY